MPKRNKNQSCPPLSLDERAEAAIAKMSEEARLAMIGSKQPTPKITKELRKLGCVSQRTNTRTCLGLHVSQVLGGTTEHRGNAWWAASEGPITSRNERTRIYA